MPKKRLKPSKGQPLKQRTFETRELRKRFLIVCEGEKTEPNYFKSFQVYADIQVVGEGANTRSLVERAIVLKDEGEYDQVWCVFDRDSFPASNFNEAFQLADQHEIKIAYSNEAFELWYLLHFDFVNTAISRSDYIRLLNKKLGFRYTKNSKQIYEALEPRLPVAMRNARNLAASYDPPNPEKDNPSTTVHRLVEQLLQNAPETIWKKEK